VVFQSTISLPFLSVPGLEAVDGAFPEISVHAFLLRLGLPVDGVLTERLEDHLVVLQPEAEALPQTVYHLVEPGDVRLHLRQLVVAFPPPVEDGGQDAVGERDAPRYHRDQHRVMHPFPLPYGCAFPSPPCVNGSVWERGCLMVGKREKKRKTGKCLQQGKRVNTFALEWG